MNIDAKTAFCVAMALVACGAYVWFHLWSKRSPRVFALDLSGSSERNNFDKRMFAFVRKNARRRTDMVITFDTTITGIYTASEFRALQGVSVGGGDCGLSEVIRYAKLGGFELVLCTDGELYDRNVISPEVRLVVPEEEISFVTRHYPSNKITAI